MQKTEQKIGNMNAKQALSYLNGRRLYESFHVIELDSVTSLVWQKDSDFEVNRSHEFQMEIVLSLHTMQILAKNSNRVFHSNAKREMQILLLLQFQTFQISPINVDSMSHFISAIDESQLHYWTIATRNNTFPRYNRNLYTVHFSFWYFAFCRKRKMRLLSRIPYRLQSPHANEYKADTTFQVHI